MAGPAPFRIRHRVALTVVPPVAGIATAIPLWNAHAEQEFLQVAAGDTLSIVNLVTVLVSIGVGLFFSLRPLAYGEARTPDLPLVAASLATAVAAFAVLALFGNPGEVEEGDEDE